MKKRFVLLLTLLLALGVCTAVVYAADSDPVDPSLRIQSFSLSLENNVYINFKVSSKNVENPAEIKILAWESAPAEYKKGTEDACLSTEGTEADTGYEVFQYTDLAAKDMTKMVYVCAYTEVDGEAVYSAPAKFSILMYAYMKKNAANPNESLVALLDGMLNYGMLTQKHFNHNTNWLATDPVHQISVTNGKLEDGFALGWYKEGSAVTLTANAPAEGMVFSHWENSAGETVATSATAEVSVNKKDTYTAKFLTETVVQHQITVIGGTLETGSTNAWYKENETISLIADEPAIGMEFSHWENSKGEIVGTAQALERTVTTSETYTAVFQISSDFFTFTELSNGTYSIAAKNVNDLPETIALPAMYNGKAVTQIAASAFFKAKQLTKVVIPDSVTTIGANAFHTCSALSDVTIPQSVTSIGTNAFYNCNSIEKISVGNSPAGTSWSSVFSASQSYINEVVILNGVTAIENSAFSNFTGLIEITIPNSVTSIGGRAFYGCTGLVEITIPNSVTSIGSSAFYGCTGLTSITIPNSVTSIKWGPFCNCTNLTSITFQGTKAQWNAISKGGSWNNNTGSYTIHCTDGDIAK